MQIGLEFVFQILPPRDGSDGQRHLPRIAPLLTHTTGTRTRCDRSDRSRLQQRNGCPSLREMPRNGRSHHSATKYQIRRHAASPPESNSLRRSSRDRADPSMPKGSFSWALQWRSNTPASVGETNKGAHHGHTTNPDLGHRAQGYDRNHRWRYRHARIAGDSPNPQLAHRCATPGGIAGRWHSAAASGRSLRHHQGGAG